MTWVAAAIVPTPPLLVPEIAGGSAGLDEGLRQACDAAVAQVLAATPDRVVVVGAAPTTGPLAGSWDWRGFGVPVPSQRPARRLPLAPAIGAWLLDRAGSVVRREVVGVAADLPTADCLALGRSLVADGRVALLVCGDGTARRDVKAPGHLDPRAERYDATIEEALRTGKGIDRLDRALAAELLVSGVPGWQVLAGAAGDGVLDRQVTWAGATYGVGYVVATWLSVAQD